MIPQAVYDLPDLAARMGMSTWRAKRYLVARGVPVRSSGRGAPRTVLLVDLRESFPELYGSLEEAIHLRRVSGDHQ